MNDLTLTVGVTVIELSDHERALVEAYRAVAEKRAAVKAAVIAKDAALDAYEKAIAEHHAALNVVGRLASGMGA